LALEDVRPKFCTSEDGELAAAVSWRSQATAASSALSGVTVWSSAFPADVVVDPFVPMQAVFDPAGRNLAILSNAAVLCGALGFLNPDVEPSKTLSIPEDLFLDESRTSGLLRNAFRTLPRMALAHAMARRMRDGAADFGATELLEDEDIEVLHADVSISGLRTAFITAPCNNLKYNYPEDYCPDLAACTLEAREDPRGVTYEGVEAVVLPPECMPGRLFFRDLEACNRLVSLGIDSQPVATFWDLARNQARVAELEIEMCLSASQTEDLRHLVPLGRNCVCFLSPEEQRISKRIEYDADLFLSVRFGKEVRKLVAQAALRWRSGHIPSRG